MSDSDADGMAELDVIDDTVDAPLAASGRQRPGGENVTSVEEHVTNYVAAKRRKLDCQFNDDAANLLALERFDGDGCGGGDDVSTESRVSGKLFAGVVIHVTGYTVPSCDELKRLMMRHGGAFNHFLYTPSRPTTHVVATNLAEAKYRALLKRSGTGKRHDSSTSRVEFVVVKPDWITDSIRRGVCLPTDAYLVCRIDRTTTTHAKLPFVATSQNRRSSTSLDSAPHLDLPRTSSSSDASAATQISQFYAKSRLHHIARLATRLRQFVTELQRRSLAEDDGDDETSLASVDDMSAVGRRWLTDVASATGANINDVTADERPTVIMHVDMDCFFVSVGLRTRPSLRGKPVAVSCGNTFSSAKSDSCAELASVSYEARAWGVRNGMHLGHALQLCPDLTTIPYADFAEYAAVAEQMYTVVAAFSLRIQAVSCDELYVDVSHIVGPSVTAEVLAEAMRRHIASVTDGCVASIGIGGNLLQARLATSRAKPDGVFSIFSLCSDTDSLDTAVAGYLRAVPVETLPGVGRVTRHKLADELGITTCGDVQNATLGVLRRVLGARTGAQLHDAAHGRDARVIDWPNPAADGSTGSNINSGPTSTPKSVSVEVNFGIRFAGENEATNFMRSLATELVERLNSVSQYNNSNFRFQQKFTSSMSVISYDITMIRPSGRHLTAKLMVRQLDAPIEPAKFMGHGACDVYTKSANGNFSDSTQDSVSRKAVDLMASIVANQVSPARSWSDVRGVGLHLSKLSLPMQREANNSAIATLFKKNASSTSQPTQRALSEAEPPPAGYERPICLSEVDVDTLAALPADIVVELRAAERLASRVSPVKSVNNSSPTRRTKTAASPAKAATSPIRDWLRPKAAKAVVAVVDIDNSGTDVTPTSMSQSGDTSCKRAELNGVSDTTAVTAQLRAWFRSTIDGVHVTNSDSGDVDCVADYFRVALRSHLCAARSVWLKFKRYVVAKLNDCNAISYETAIAWTGIINRIENAIQREMIIRYGCRLHTAI